MNSIWRSLSSKRSSPRPLAGPRIILRCCSSSTSTLISTGFSRAADLNERLAATLRSCGSAGIRHLMGDDQMMFRIHGHLHVYSWLSGYGQKELQAQLEKQTNFASVYPLYVAKA